MYYHNSPTPHQLKAVKRAKAIEMKRHTDAMKLITKKYTNALTMLETLRDIEIELSNAIKQDRLTPEQIVEAQGALRRNRAKASRVVGKILAEFTPDN